MKLGRILAISVLILVLAATLGCSAQNPADQQQATVSKGDLSIKISGSGKSSYAVDSKLFFSSIGKVEKVSVKEGDFVKKGTVLAKLETDSLELALSEAQVAQAQAQVALTQLQSARTQADILLTQAQFNLDRTQAVSDILDDITRAQNELQIARMQAEEDRIYSDTESAQYWSSRILQLQYNLVQYQQKLADLLSKAEFSGDFIYLQGQKYDRLAVEDARIKQLQVTSAQQGVQQAEQNIEQAKLSVDQAAKAVALAQKQLKDATITAPIDGIVATLDIKEGDIIATAGSGLGTPIYMVDPNSLELNIEVDEIDVAQTKLAQKAVINLDAIPDTKYEGTVSAISTLPISKVQNSGVVVYEVKVIFAGQIPESVKSGMSATVDIVTQEKKDVVLVPSKSIKRDSKGQTTVSIIVNQKVEERQVVIGLSDGTQTEVISGLNVGDIVVKPLQNTDLKSI
jgi:HlyD family secretion protein